MTETASKPDPKEIKTKVVLIRVTDDEKALIKAKARTCNLSMSRYLVLLGTSYTPPSKLDSTHMLALAKVNADQGRLGGLLRMWLSNEERVTPALEQRLEALLGQIESCQDELRSIASKLK